MAGILVPEAGLQTWQRPCGLPDSALPAAPFGPFLVRGYESQVIRIGEEMALLGYPHFHLSFESQSDTVPTLEYIQLLLPAFQLLFISSTVVLDAAL